eukprot:jgi/Phyca11/100404/e_gw1.4.1211.1
MENREGNTTNRAPAEQAVATDKLKTKTKQKVTRPSKAKKREGQVPEQVDQSGRGITRSGKKAPIFWDSDGVDGGKSSLRVVLEWMTNPANYNKWRGSDRTSGKTKEALLPEIVAQLKAVCIEHRDSPGVREKINSLEKQWRQAEDFRLATGAGITDEKSLRDALLKRCPYYYDLHDVMMTLTLFASTQSRHV